ncbi:MAG: hypothetical protein KGJ64_05725 [Betaproteobacteria bacterium]|nr:hypothetical protein [Betaproteobacteria bacterium]
MLVWIAIRWLLATSVMPLFVGAGTGWLSRRLLAPAPGAWTRQVGGAALAAWLCHVLLVGSGLLRDGAMLDYAAVLLAAVAASGLACRRA